MKRFFFLFLCLITFCSCSNEILFENNNHSSVKDSFVKSQLDTNNHICFNVSEHLLKKYLRLFEKKRIPETIKPIVRNNETLAYYVQYCDNKGWDLISADKRLTPVLVSSPRGSLPEDFEYIQNFAPVAGMLQSVVATKESKSTIEDGIWNFLSPNSGYEKTVPIKLENIIKTKGLNGIKGLGEGMWIAVDTIIVDTTIIVPKLITTNWYQSSPFNDYTPQENGSHCPVGCSPIALGQILYKYFKNNPGLHTIPSTASVINSVVSFGPTSSEAWGHLKENSNANCDTTAVFLSWLGWKMGVEYHLDRTGADWSNLTTTLNDYLNFSNGYSVNNNSSTTLKTNFCNTILSSINEGSPLIVESSNLFNDTLHVFIIDYYEQRLYQYCILYQFDPYHIITDDDYYNYPSWRFDWPNGFDPDKDVAEFDEIINMTDVTYIGMNWGWKRISRNHIINENPNDLLFSLRSTTHLLGENGTYYDSDNVNLLWAVSDGHSYSGVTHFVHHLNYK
ncbi:MAG: hypothetical protein E7108_05445 [Bacteroidales bacterium]|nr:hypothetical protein [Bacteroidales bacterium]